MAEPYAPLDDFEIEEDVDYSLDFDEDALNAGFEEEDAQRAKEEEERQAKEAAEAEAKKAAIAAATASKSPSFVPSTEDRTSVPQPSRSQPTIAQEAKAPMKKPGMSGSKHVPIPIPPKSFSESVNPLDKGLPQEPPRAAGGRTGRGEAVRGKGRGRGRGDRESFLERQGGRGFEGRNGIGGRNGMTGPRPPQVPFPSHGNHHQNQQGRIVYVHRMPSLQMQPQPPSQHMFGSSAMRMTPPMMANGGLPMPPGVGMLPMPGMMDNSKPSAADYKGLDSWSEPHNGQTEGRQGTESSTAEFARRFPSAGLKARNTAQAKGFFAHGMDSAVLTNGTRKRVMDRLSSVPRLAGEEGAAERPRKRISPDPAKPETSRRGNNGGGLGGFAGLPLPMPMGAGKVQELKEEEERRKKMEEIEEFREKQALENALIRKQWELDKEARRKEEIETLQKEIARMEALRAPKAEPKRKAQGDLEEQNQFSSPKRKAEIGTDSKSPSKAPSRMQSEEPQENHRNGNQQLAAGDLRDFLNKQRTQKKDINKGPAKFAR